MLTRLKVSGFKNLVDVDVRFGPFTCVAGVNGVGKSNLFDAIRLLSALADRPLVDAALSVRDEGGRTTDVRSLFHRVADNWATEISFEAEMIVPYEAWDDLGQKARASITFLRYSLTLAYRPDNGIGSLGSLELRREELEHINLGDAPQHLRFEHEPSWRKSAVKGRRTSPFVSTRDKEGGRVIELHQDGTHGRPLSRLAANLPRTVVSSANAAESPTALLARREMQSWRLLHLEPSALRRPDEFKAPPRLGLDGAHLPATLYHLAHRHKENGSEDSAAEETARRVCARVANRLAELITDVYEVRVDKDDRRELLTLEVSSRDGTSYPARALSDGTLRFLALAVLELDPEAHGLLCLEEPENGIHPERIPAMLRLLQDIASNTQEPVGPDNPLRQVIVNTHSPAVVAQVPDDSLLVAELKEGIRNDRRFERVCFSPLPNTWRHLASSDVVPVARGKLLAYLNPIQPPSCPGHDERSAARGIAVRRVADRPDVQLILPFPSGGE
ncbi:MAG: AAA family ATPase [Acidobacteriota bacterium]